MVEGRSGLLEVAGPWIREWRPSLGTLKFRDGAVATLFSGASPELLRDPEHDFAWCDELAKWEGAGLLGHAPVRPAARDTPARAHHHHAAPRPVLRAIMASPGTVRIGGPSDANPHTSAFWRRDMAERYAGTRLARQELDGELLTDTPGALWTVELLASCRAQGSDWGPIARQRAEPASVGQPATARSTGCPGDIRAPERGDRTDVTDSLRDGPQRPAFTRIVIGVAPPPATAPAA
jgi:phage terminase large subunit-like protein